MFLPLSCCRLQVSSEGEVRESLLFSCPDFTVLITILAQKANVPTTRWLYLSLCILFIFMNLKIIHVWTHTSIHMYTYKLPAYSCEMCGIGRIWIQLHSFTVYCLCFGTFFPTGRAFLVMLNRSMDLKLWHLGSFKCYSLLCFKQVE